MQFSQFTRKLNMVSEHGSVRTHISAEENFYPIDRGYPATSTPS